MVADLDAGGACQLHEDSVFQWEEGGKTVYPDVRLPGCRLLMKSNSMYKNIYKIYVFDVLSPSLGCPLRSDELNGGVSHEKINSRGSSDAVRVRR